MNNTNNRLAPLTEEPIINEEHDYNFSTRNTRANTGFAADGKKWRNWVKNQLFSSLLFLKNGGNKDDDHDLKILLGVMACPLFPLSLHPKHHQLPITDQVSSAQYIIQHFVAATGCRKLETKLKNVYATGKVRMSMVDDQLISSTAGVVGPTPGNGGLRKGCFVLWQMIPNKWLIELVLGNHKVVAGSDGSVAWRHTPWLRSHAAKGGVRPLRRALQGLDPLAVSAMFSTAQYMGEKKIFAADCFVLKLSADQTDLVDRSDNTAEMIKHVIFGYFSQKNGLLIYLEDSYLTRIQTPGNHPIYWETTMSTKMEDYRTVDGVMIAHGGQSSGVISRFGDNLKTGPMITRMEETWMIDDLAFNVPGLSMDCFIPPEELHKDNQQTECDDWRSPVHQRS